MMFAVIGCVVTGVAACGGTRAERPMIDPSHTGPAEVLAPSQQAAVTVAEPAIPVACDPAVIEVSAGEPSGIGKPDAIVLLTNIGSAECEVNLEGSILLGAEVEPSVWLLPGEAGELWVITTEDRCESGRTASGSHAGFPLEVNGVERMVDIVDPVPCVALTAFFVADPL